MRRGRAPLSDFLLVSGFVALEADELSALLASGAMRRVEQPQRIWSQLWAVANAADAEPASSRGERERTRPPDGAEVWRVAAQQTGSGGAAGAGGAVGVGGAAGGGAVGDGGAARAQLAEAALALWHDRLMRDGEGEARLPRTRALALALTLALA